MEVTTLIRDDKTRAFRASKPSSPSKCAYLSTKGPQLPLGSRIHDGVVMRQQPDDCLEFNRYATQVSGRSLADPADEAQHVLDSGRPLLPGLCVVTGPPLQSLDLSPSTVQLLA